MIDKYCIDVILILYYHYVVHRFQQINSGINTIVKFNRVINTDFKSMSHVLKLYLSSQVS